MPLWPRRRQPVVTAEAEPAPGPEALAEKLCASLSDAILKGDTAEARRLFDQAFWEKVPFRPDGYHLLRAVRQNDREMVKLLTTHGAAWTPEETRLARVFAGPEAWQNVEGLLRQAGMRTVFEAGELRRIDPVAATTWARRTLDDAERLQAPDAARLRRELENITAASVAALYCRDDAPAALKLLQSRGAQAGDGSAAHPLEVSREFEAMLRLARHDTARALHFLDALTQAGLHVRPLTLGTRTLQFAPGVVTALQARGLLDEESPDQRLALLRHWTVLQREVANGENVLKFHDSFIDAGHEALGRAAAVLFRRERQATAAEADAFVALHEARVRQTPLGLARVEKKLLELGFFDGAAFTESHFRRLASASLPAESSTDGLAARFNRLAEGRRIAGAGIVNFLKPSKFGEFEEALRDCAFKPGAGDTVKVLDYLAAQIKKDAVTPRLVSTLRALKAGGADFGKLDPHRYLGRNAPGLAKALLDEDVVTAAAFNFDALAKRSGDELRLITPPEDPDYLNQEFLCQVMLEKIAPQRFVALRGREGTSYQQQFLREWASNPALKRHSILTGSLPERKLQQPVIKRGP